ncbi:MAG: hypothetical protein IJV25_05640 [Prevotella sp.]|nr:hypothetical protein [Prevotella sp.]
MKKIMMTLAMMVTIVTSAAAMTFNEAREHALFLTDKMAYELGLSTAQINNVYEINYDFVIAVAIQGQPFSACQSRRDMDMRFVLSDYQYHLYKKTKYFYHPMSSSRNVWSFSIYNYYTDRGRMYSTQPSHYKDYRGPANPRKSYSPPARPYAGKELRKQQRINPHSNAGRK